MKGMDCLDYFWKEFAALEEKIGHSFSNQTLLLTAFTHCSYLNENRDQLSEHNERLEFLGDSILNFFISEWLYLQFPHLPEGVLSQKRAFLVDRTACSAYTDALEIAPYLLLGKGELESGGRERESLKANLFEALLAALFLDGGVEVAKKFLLSRSLPALKKRLLQPRKNWKADLQEWTQRHYQSQPEYILTGDWGPEHGKQFSVGVWMEGKLIGRGEGKTKKEAEQEAARQSLGELARSIDEKAE